MEPQLRIATIYLVEKIKEDKEFANRIGVYDKSDYRKEGEKK